MSRHASALSADAVCAFVWERADEREREILCSLASAKKIAAILLWFELEPDDKNKLRVEIADLIQASADRQRNDWQRQAERIRENAAR